MKLEKVTKIVLKLFDKIKQQLTNVFIAKENEPQIVRAKHIRLGILLFAAFIAMCFLIIEFGNRKPNQNNVSKPKEKINANVSAIESLTKGVSNEQTWTEIRGKEVDEIKNKQIAADAKQSELEEKILSNKVSKDELADLIIKLKTDIEETYNSKLQNAIGQILEDNSKKIPQAEIESTIIKPKKKIKKIGEYIPANSYVQAKLISGVDAGVGISSEANPRHTLLRITGETISAGIGADFLKTNRLVGCLLSAKAVGDISSEKAYLDGVLLTCAIDKQTAIEVPVKAYITSHAKSGIRGEVVSREGDMVLKSFLSGMASGFGSGVQQLSQPNFSFSGSSMNSSKQSANDLLRGGLGSGVSSSSDTLSQYFIKRAEQYQPVISVDEGIEVYVVFQEGFSLKEEDENAKKTN